MRQHKTTETIQPGLLPVFRFFAWLQIGIGTLYIGLIFAMTETMSLLAVVPLLSALVLRAALSTERLEHLLRQRYLPFMLFYATGHVIGLFGLGWQLMVTAPLLNRLVSVNITLPFGIEAAQVNNGDLIASSALLIVLSNLFFLMLLVSWQYDWRGIVGFCCAATLLDLVINVVPVVNQSLLILPNVGIILFRNVIFIQTATVIRRLLYVQGEQRAALVEANAQLTRHAITAEELAISRERNRLARELHDTLAHTLSAATVQLEAAQARWSSDNDKARAAVDKTLVITREGLVETRRALKALRASPLETLGIERALHDLIALMQQRSRAAITLEMSSWLPSLAPEGEQTLYRAVQEALENALRHAHAAHITVTIERTDATLMLHVRDDGVGFDPTRTDLERFGLRGLRERAHASGGDMQVISTPGQGTIVQMELPLT
jgi:signal transduction histidine kinase